MQKNRIAAARTLCRSLKASRPNDRCYVLVVDETAGYLDPAAEPFELVTLEQLGIPDLAAFRFKYHITELCTAAKPYLLESLLQHAGVERLLYLDPDILVTNPLDGLFERLGSCDVVLTPHTLADFPDDGLYPDHSTVYTTGLMNLGFVGVNASDNALIFLRWWQGKVQQDCVVDPNHGYFFDQKFVDFALILFERIHVERNRGYNVAFWNLHERTVSRADSGWRCNDTPLYFFHFSGYRPRDTEQITTYFAAEARRHSLGTRPDLRALFAEYSALVYDNGYEEASAWPYTYATFANGDAIPYHFRALYRRSPADLAQFGDPFTSQELAHRLSAMRDAADGGTLPHWVALAYRSIPGLRPFYRGLLKRSPIGRGLFRLLASRSAGATFPEQER